MIYLKRIALQWFPLWQVKLVNPNKQKQTDQFEIEKNKKKKRFYT